MLPQTAKTRRRVLCFEQFESRRLMAVTTSLSAGTLTITGDAAADDIAVMWTGNWAELAVTGRNGTSVNGTPDGTATIGGVTADLVFLLGDGNNVLFINNTYIAGDIEITTGSGNDFIVLGSNAPVSPGRRLDVNTGDGNDLFSTLQVYVGESAAIDLGEGGSDRASLFRASAAQDITVANVGSTGYMETFFTQCTAGGTLGAFNHGRAGSIALTLSAASRTIQVGGRTGLNHVYIDTCYAAGYIHVETFNSSQPLIASSENGSVVTVARCQTLQLIVRTGSNVGVLPEPDPGLSDRVFVYGNLVVGPPYVLQSSIGVSQAIYVETGKAADLVELSYNVTYERLFSHLGDEDDELYVTGNQVNQNATLDGGSGTDSLTEIGNILGSRTVLNFP
jgi:hypothetical protein